MNSITPRAPRGRNALWLAAGVALAASAALVRTRTRAVESDYAPIGQFLDVDDVRLHYVQRGRGEPLLVLHGNGSNLLDLELSGLLDRASQAYRVIAFDRPGSGYSTRPRTTVWTPHAQARLLKKALEQLGVVRPIIVGHSLGTQVALSMALQFPEEVRSLALLSGYYFPSARVDAIVGSAPAIPGVGDLMRYTVSPWLGRLAWPLLERLIFDPSPVPQSFRAYPPWMSLRPVALRTQAAEMALGVAAAASLSAHYREIKLPVVILAGTDDRYVNTAANSVRLHRELPQSELTLVPGAGHMVHHLVLEEVMSAIDAAAASPARQLPVHKTAQAEGLVEGMA
jgi:pimeloyl-ACP methyl ester carboxylesterase